MKKILLLTITLMLALALPLYAEEYEAYVIQDGDTLYNIAQNYGTTVDEIIVINPELENPDLIVTGSEVKLPAGGSQSEEAFNLFKKKDAPVDESIQKNSEAEKVLELVNAQRAENGLKPLAVSKELTKMAKEKCEDMSQNNYFGHDSQKNGRITNILAQKKIKYQIVGENLARNFQSADKVFEAWMKSDSHRTNILHKDFDQTGIYYLQTETGSYWVQNFIDAE
ncbi:MAG: CAP domain-containing protein [Clostridiales bacterium]|jgi:uncharacterized protein YkwD|nr:CAP domain-containing protein [Clostridiales bacterium]